MIMLGRRHFWGSSRAKPCSKQKLINTRLKAISSSVFSVFQDRLHNLPELLFQFLTTCMVAIFSYYLILILQRTFLSCLFPIPVPSEMSLAPPTRVQDSRKVSLSLKLSQLCSVSSYPLCSSLLILMASAGTHSMCQCLFSIEVSKRGHRTPVNLTITEDKERLTFPTSHLHFTSAALDTAGLLCHSSTLLCFGQPALDQDAHPLIRKMFFQLALLHRVIAAQGEYPVTLDTCPF